MSPLEDLKIELTVSPEVRRLVNSIETLALALTPLLPQDREELAVDLAREIQRREDDAKKYEEILDAKQHTIETLEAQIITSNQYRGYVRGILVTAQEALEEATLIRDEDQDLAAPIYRTALTEICEHIRRNA